MLQYLPKWNEDDIYLVTFNSSQFQSEYKLDRLSESSNAKVNWFKKRVKFLVEDLLACQHQFAVNMLIFFGMIEPILLRRAQENMPIICGTGSKLACSNKSFGF